MPVFRINLRIRITPGGIFHILPMFCFSKKYFTFSAAWLFFTVQAGRGFDYIERSRV